VVMAARPGRIVATVPIDEPHPRADAFRLRPAFAEHCQRLSQLVADAAAGAGA
jgi:NitT/TauT family transport system ATP-binding protein